MIIDYFDARCSMLDARNAILNKYLRIAENSFFMKKCSAHRQGHGKIPEKTPRKARKIARSQSFFDEIHFTRYERSTSDEPRTQLGLCAKFYLTEISFVAILNKQVRIALERVNTLDVVFFCTIVSPL